MRNVARDGFIRKTKETRPTKNRARHGPPVIVWESLTQAESEAA